MGGPLENFILARNFRSRSKSRNGLIFQMRGVKIYPPNLGVNLQKSLLLQCHLPPTPLNSGGEIFTPEFGGYGFSGSALERNADNSGRSLTLQPLPFWRSEGFLALRSWEPTRGPEPRKFSSRHPEPCKKNFRGRKKHINIWHLRWAKSPIANR